MDSVQYTVRGISGELDAHLREEARATGRSLNAVVVETLEQATLPAAHHDDLDWFIGADTDRPDQRKVDAARDWLDGLPSDLA
jgi:antitoxin FitA-like protein